MPQAKGSAARFAYVPEVVWGTTPGGPAMKQLAAAVYGESLGGSMGEIESNAIRATRGRQEIRGGDFNVSGSIPFELAPLGIASILKAALGANVTTGAGPYVHTMKRGAAIPSLAVEKGFVDLAKYFVFNGVKVDKMSMNINGENSLVTGALDVIGKSFAVPAGAQLGVPTIPVHTPFTEFEAAITEGGGAVQLLNFGMSMTNDLERVAGIGSRFAVGLNEGNGTCDINMTLLFDTDALVLKWMNETQTQCQVTMASGATSIALLFPALKYFGDSIPKIATPQGIVVELAGKCKYDVTEATDIKVTVTNTETVVA